MTTSVTPRVFWWLLGGFFFVLGVRHLVEGRESDALMYMTFGLVLIAAGSEKLRQSLTNFFLTILVGLWEFINKLISGA